MGDTVTDSTLWNALERWSATAFLVAGVLLVGFAALLGYEAFANASAPEDLFGPPGFFSAMVGLLGLYPTLADRTPRLASIGVAGAAVGAVGWLLITIFAVTEAAGILPALEVMSVIGGTIVLVAGIAMVLAYVGNGVASLRIDRYLDSLGLLLLVPPAIFGVMLAQAALFVQFGLFSERIMTWSAVALAGGQALAHVGTGYVLRTGPEPTDRAQPAPGSSVR